MDWNDLKPFLAVARTGSTLAASKVLRVNQTTCARAVASLEKGMGLTLFERSASGYRPTPGGESLIAYAEQVEAAAAELARAARDLARAERAEVRFSTSDVLADLFAGPAIASFAQAHPEIRVTLHVDSRAVALGDEADVALRAAPVMTDPQLVVRKVMETPWAFYRGTNWASGRKPPDGVEEARHHPIATLEGRPHAMLLSALPGANIRYVSNAMKALVDVLKTSECIGALPMLVGDAHPELKRCFVLDIDAGGLWIVFPERLRQAPHLRAFVDHLIGFVHAWKREAERQGNKARLTP